MEERDAGGGEVGSKDIPTNAAEMISAVGLERRRQTEESPKRWKLSLKNGWFAEEEDRDPGMSHIFMKQAKNWRGEYRCSLRSRRAHDIKFLGGR